MQPRRNGLVTTALMIVPMMAVPLMAIFGVPQFAAVVASPTDHDADFDFPMLKERRVGQSDAAPGRTVAVTTAPSIDLFRPYGAQQVTDGRAESNESIQQTPWVNPLAGGLKELPAPQPNSQANDRANSSMRNASVRSARQLPQQVYDVFSDNFDQRAAEGRVATNAASPRDGQGKSAPKNHQVEFPQFTWREAVDRLNELGASTYRLTPGMHPQEFRFVCFVTSVDDMRITRRFEAEAGDPLVAVEKVLAQVEQSRK